jgi:hypothetical protein
LVAFLVGSPNPVVAVRPGILRRHLATGATATVRHRTSQKHIGSCL